jgi:hypothetical protein
LHVCFGSVGKRHGDKALHSVEAFENWSLYFLNSELERSKR